MKRISALGAAALLVLGLYATVSTVASASPVATAAETIGYSMLALALIGGGAAFIVLARRRLA